ncbi:MAG: hypothetical protein HQ488_00050 [Parcubacteria group bacterium]|nr:hypothetical protein [Parcubacteria group bacterium]
MMFAIFLKKFLSKKEVGVVNHLNDDDIDVILHVSPFPHLMKAASYSYLNAWAYKLIHPRTVIIQRVNECDERKGTSYINRLLLKVSRRSDFVVFISTWLKRNLIAAGFDKDKPNQVILNGADDSVFFSSSNTPVGQNNEQLKFVTHHWSSNMMKGHDVYKQIDELLGDEEFSKMFSFTYIGNVPSGLSYENTRVLAPLSGEELAEELRAHDFYLTATLNEPAGMHHIEGALCRLPLLYRNSGALPEYCTGFGLMFDENNFKEKLVQMKNEFRNWNERIGDYSNTADHMAQEYLNLINQLYQDADKFQLKPKTLFTEIVAVLFKTFSKVHTFIYKVIVVVKRRFSV